jgi:TRAP-type C4-dicarboxylate transport system substrate-binding protein
MNFQVSIKRLISTTAAVSVVAGGLLAARAGIAPAQAQQVEGPGVTWLVSLWGPRRGQTEGLERMAELLSERTDGNFTLDLRYGEALSSPRENLQGIHAGAFEMAMFCTGYDAGKTPGASGLELPFSPAQSFLDRAEWEEDYIHNPVVLEEMARWNAYPIMMGTLPAPGIMGRGEAPASLEDLSGRRIQATQTEAQIYSTFGASVTTIPSVELYQAMERGVVDAVSFPWTYAFFTYRLDELSTWYSTDLGGVLGRNTCPIVANLQAYEALPKQYRDLIEEVKGEAYRWQEDAYGEADERNLAIVAERGTEEVHFPQAELDALYDTNRDRIWNDWIAARTAEGLPGAELADALSQVPTGKFEE